MYTHCAWRANRCYDQSVGSLLCDKVCPIHHEAIHVILQHALYRVFHGADDRFLVLVETGVDEAETSGAFMPGVNNIVVERVVIPVDDLRTGGAIHMHDGR